MRIDVITTFPEFVEAGISYSIVKRARDKDVLKIYVHDLRNWTHDRHRSTDDEPFGGGAGMVMKPEPVFEAIEALKAENPDKEPRVVLMTPQGRPFSQKLAHEMAVPDEWFIFICGHYEGFDERIREHLATDEISIGDYVLTGGELPALVIIDAVTRLLPGALGAEESAEQDSFSDGLLEYPHYTRPADFRGWKVPEVLLSGHHANIAKWRRKESLRRTLERRPDLLEKIDLTKADLRLLEDLKREQMSGEDSDVINH
jgi:tRNA (guanine37-N1)-methyltransferase